MSTDLEFMQILPDGRTWSIQLPFNLIIACIFEEIDEDAAADIRATIEAHGHWTCEHKGVISVIRPIRTS